MSHSVPTTCPSLTSKNLIEDFLAAYNKSSLGETDIDTFIAPADRFQRSSNWLNSPSPRHEAQYHHLRAAAAFDEVASMI